MEKWQVWKPQWRRLVRGSRLGETVRKSGVLLVADDAECVNTSVGRRDRHQRQELGGPCLKGSGTFIASPTGCYHLISSVN